jgi:hypothetical protein
LCDDKLWWRMLRYQTLGPANLFSELSVPYGQFDLLVTVSL